MRIGPHFNDGDVGFCAGGEQGQRHANVVVEVANGGVNVGVSLFQYAFHQFLGCGLAIASRQANYRAGPLPSVPTSQGLQGCQRVGHQNETGITRRGVHAFIHDSSDASGFDGLLSVGIPVEIFAFQGEKQLASSCRACICRDTG